MAFGSFFTMDEYLAWYNQRHEPEQVFRPRKQQGHHDHIMTK